MDTKPLTISSWPKAILHLDADAFFASCEQAIHPELKGRPVITGKERGIVSAASYEAKAKGVKRGMRLFEVKKACPDAVIIPSDYETYSLFSVRMFEILRRFSPDAEVQRSLFDDNSKVEKMAKIYTTIDVLSEKFGKYIVHHAASLATKIQAQHEGERGDVPQRLTGLLKGENKRQRLGLPVLHIKV